MRIGFIGTGEITKAVVLGILKSKIKYQKIYISRRNKKISNFLKSKSNKINILNNNQDIINKSKIVFLAITPEVGKKIIKGLKFKKSHIVVSFISTINYKDLKKYIKINCQIVRAIPLPPISLGIGPVPIFPKNKYVKSFFDKIGKTIEINNEKLSLNFWAMSSMMAPYYEMLSHLSNWLTKRGLSKKQSENYSIGAELKHDKIMASPVTNQQQSIGDYALFASLSYQPIKAITIKPAMRYAYNSVYKAPVVPSLSFLVEINKNTQLRAAVAKGFRAPDLKELYLEFHYNSSINLWGNTNLKAENSDHINVSLDWNKKVNQHRFQLSPKMYYSNINNLISLVRISEVDWEYQNINFLTTKGVALNAVYQSKGTGAADYNTTTYKYTAPVNGIYHITLAGITNASSTSSHYNFDIDGTQQYVLTWSSSREYHGTTLQYLNAGQVVGFKSANTSGYYRHSDSLPSSSHYTYGIFHLVEEII